jgi:hypothetical protein
MTDNSDTASWSVNGHSTAGLPIPPPGGILDDEDSADDRARAWD